MAVLTSRHLWFGDISKCLSWMRMKDKTNDFSFITQDLVLTDTMISLDESLEFQEQYPEILNYLSFGNYRFEQYKIVAEPNHKFDRCILSIYSGGNLVWTSDDDFGKVVSCRYDVAKQVLSRINKVLSLGWVKQ